MARKDNWEETYEKVQALHDKHYLRISNAFRRWAESIEPLREEKRKKAYNTCTYLEELTTCEGWQISRIYIADYRVYMNGTYKLDKLFVAYEYWNNPVTHRSVLLGKYVGMCPMWRRIPFIYTYWGETEVMVHRSYNYKRGMTTPMSGWYGDNNWYEGWKTYVYPRKRVLDEYKRVDLDKLISKAEDTQKVLRGLTASNVLETLAKTPMGTESMFREYFLYDRGKEIDRYFRSLVIANRHGYITEELDLGNYLDYLSELDYLHRDLRSPHYLCPTDFKEALSLTSRMVQNEKERREERRKINEQVRSLKKKEKQNEDYINARGKYFSLEFGNDTYVVSPLKSVEEFCEEGINMHHCVYSCEYYNMSVHPNALILSVRNRQGGREVTIEYDLKSNTIKQCFAKHDSKHADDESIRELVMAHEQDIKAISEPSRTKKRVVA